MTLRAPRLRGVSASHFQSSPLGFESARRASLFQTRGSALGPLTRPSRNQTESTTRSPSSLCLFPSLCLCGWFSCSETKNSLDKVLPKTATSRNHAKAAKFLSLRLYGLCVRSHSRSKQRLLPHTPVPWSDYPWRWVTTAIPYLPPLGGPPQPPLPSLETPFCPFCRISSMRR